MRFVVKGLEKWKKAWDRLRGAMEGDVVVKRKEAAELLILELVANMPVWSGRAVSTVGASNSPHSLSIPHPDRGNQELDGKYRHHAEYGHTSRMPLGGEPMRLHAENAAMASLETTDFSLRRDVYVGSAHYLMGLINEATAPDAKTARNKAVVEDLAKEAVRQHLRRKHA